MTTKPHIPIQMIEPESEAHRCRNHDCEQGDTCPARLQSSREPYPFLSTLVGFLALVAALMAVYSLLS